jgi:hypothetical protein
MEPHIADNDVRHLLGRQLRLTTVGLGAAGRPTSGTHLPHASLGRTA